VEQGKVVSSRTTSSSETVVAGAEAGALKTARKAQIRHVDCETNAFDSPVAGSQQQQSVWLWGDIGDASW
jgi:hypothetical protein